VLLFLQLRTLPSSALVHVLWGLAKLSALQDWHPAESLLHRLFAAMLDAVPELGRDRDGRCGWCVSLCGCLSLVEMEDPC
jgi:hypothetical protein